VPGADEGYADEPVDEGTKRALLGRYRVDLGEGVEVVIEEDRRGNLSLRRAEEEFGRRLFHQGEMTFHPAGAPATRIVFEVEYGPSIRMEIQGGGGVLAGARVG